MKQICHEIIYKAYESYTTLPLPDQELLKLAIEAIKGSYAPYSRFHVGAAVKLASGEVFTGSNQENMAFPAGTCAERVALFAASSARPDIPVVAIAVSALSDTFEVTEPVTPCGICRQAIAEWEFRYNTGIRTILGGKQGPIYVFDNMESLLPLAFRENGLVK